MINKFDQPTEAQEAANAAFVWRKKVQADLVDSLRKVDITLETAEFWFERFRRAYQREIDTAAAAKRSQSPQSTTEGQP